MVMDIYVPERYKGFSQNYYGDLAILVINKQLKLTSRIQPICVDWDKLYRRSFLTPSNTGLVSGWGAISEKGEISETLQEIAVPYVSREECSKAISENDRSYLTDDKLCLGYLNQSKGVCAGDSGSALVFKNNFDNRFYLTGIVSISPDVKIGYKCNSQLYTLYTEVYAYLDFIREKAAEHAIDTTTSSHKKHYGYGTWGGYGAVGGWGGHHFGGGHGHHVTRPPLREHCTLPQIVGNGTWNTVGANVTIIVTDSVAYESIVSLKCDRNFKLFGSELNFCQNGIWEEEIAVCLEICPPLIVANSTQISCIRTTENGDVAVECSEATNGTIAIIQCNNQIGSSQNGTAYYYRVYSICSDGRWNPEKPTCTLDCGSVKTSDYPWKVAIYEKESNNNKELICGGILINERVVLTAAHCITNSDGELLSPNNYQISVGNHHMRFRHPEDIYSQTSTVAEMFIPENYEGVANKFIGDIAVIILEKCFRFTPQVQPPCLDYHNLYESLQTSAYVAGWGSNEFNRKSPEKMKPSMEVKVVQVPLVPKDDCLKKVSLEYKELVEMDKICVGAFKNETNKICKGDGGSGLFFKNPYDGKYYVSGLASIILDDECGHYTGFTRISQYLSGAILEKILVNTPSKEKCDLLMDNYESRENFNREVT